MAGQRRIGRQGAHRGGAVESDAADLAIVRLARRHDPACLRLAGAARGEVERVGLGAFLQVARDRDTAGHAGRDRAQVGQGEVEGGGAAVAHEVAIGGELDARPVDIGAPDGDALGIAGHVDLGAGGAAQQPVDLLDADGEVIGLERAVGVEIAGLERVGAFAVEAEGAIERAAREVGKGREVAARRGAVEADRGDAAIFGLGRGHVAVDLGLCRAGGGEVQQIGLGAFFQRAAQGGAAREPLGAQPGQIGQGDVEARRAAGVEQRAGGGHLEARPVHLGAADGDAIRIAGDVDLGVGGALQQPVDRVDADLHIAGLQRPVGVEIAVLERVAAGALEACRPVQRAVCDGGKGRKIGRRSVAGEAHRHDAAILALAGGHHAVELGVAGARGHEVERVGVLALVEGAGQRGRAAHRGIDQRQVGQGEVELSGARARLKLRVGGDHDARPVEIEVAQERALLGARGGGVECQVAGQQAVDLRDACGEIGGVARHGDVEAARDRLGPARDAHVGIAAELTPGKAGEAGKILGADLQVRLNGRVGTLGQPRKHHVALHADARAAEVDAGDLERRALLPVELQRAGHRVPGGLGQRGIREGETGHVEVKLPAHRAGNAACLVLGDDAGAGELGALKRHLGAVEPLQRQLKRELVAHRGVEEQRQRCLFQQRLVLREGQPHRAAILGGDAARQAQPLGPALGADARFTIERQGGGLERQLVKLDGAAGLENAAGAQQLVVAEKGALLLRQQRPQVALEVGGKAVAFFLDAFQRDLTAKAVLAIGGKREIGGEIVDHALALYREADRRGTGQAHLGGQQAAGAFLEHEIDQQLAAVIGIAAGEIQRIGGAVLPHHGKLDIALAIGELGGALDIERDLLADHRRAKLDRLDGEAADIDRDRQVGQRKAAAAGLRGRRGRAGGGQAGERQPLGAQLVDLQPAAQQGKTAPVELGILQRQPDALIVGNGQALHRGLRAQRAAKAAHRHVHAVARKRVLDQAFKPGALVVFLRHRGQGQSEKQGEEKEKPFQNA